MKSVTVHLQASLRRKRSGGGRGDRVATQAATVGELLRELGVPEAQAAMMFVNGERARPGSAIRDGDEIRVFPLVGGG
ncbi:MAG: MoaD/ThiS family protein [Spirochaetales bacterium]|nr:MoaD/ThiS family protein [Spirochaetales bacterium]